MNVKTVIVVNILVLILMWICLFMHIDALIFIIGSVALTFFSLPDQQGYRFRMITLIGVQTFIVAIFYESDYGLGVSLYGETVALLSFWCVAALTTKSPRSVTFIKDVPAILICSVGLIGSLTLIFLVRVI